MNEVQSEIQKRKDKHNSSIDKAKEQLFATWTKEQEELLAEWAEKGSCYRWLHSRAEKKYRCRNYSFTIPVIVMSTLTGTANFAMDSFVPAEFKKAAMASVGGVNILAGIISTLQNFLRYAELMEAHRSAGVSWSKLSRDICVELALDPPRRKPAGDFLNICRAEYDRLIEQSPMIDDSILLQFHNKFDKSDINKPEMCNGLDKCEIYKPSEEPITASKAAPTLPTLRFNSDNQGSKEMRDNKTELRGVYNMGKVSNMKHIKVNSNSPEIRKEAVHSELIGILASNDIESNLDTTDTGAATPSAPSGPSAPSAPAPSAPDYSGADDTDDTTDDTTDGNDDLSELHQ